MFQLIVKKLLKTIFSLKIHLNKKKYWNLGTLLVLLENFQFKGFNEGVWICKNSMAFVKNIEC
jgi:hypothetical protein